MLVLCAGYASKSHLVSVHVTGRGPPVHASVTEAVPVTYAAADATLLLTAGSNSAAQILSLQAAQLQQLARVCGTGHLRLAQPHTAASPLLRMSSPCVFLSAMDAAAGVPLPQPLPNRRQGGQLPLRFSAHEVLATEGATYSWLHNQVQRLYLHAPCAEQGNHAAWQPPPGWQLQK